MDIGLHLWWGDAFFASALIQDAVVRNIEILGEAVKGVSQATREAHPEIP